MDSQVIRGVTNILLALALTLLGGYALILFIQGSSHGLDEARVPDVLLTVTPPLKQTGPAADVLIPSLELPEVLETGWWIRVPRPPIRSFTVHKFEDCVEVEIIQCPDSGHSFCFPSVLDR